MQQAQQNYKKKVIGLLTGWTILAGSVAYAGIAIRGAPEPLLQDGVGPCDPQTGQPDFVPGVDVNGNPVAPADLAKANTPVVVYVSAMPDG